MIFFSNKATKVVISGLWQNKKVLDDTGGLAKVWDGGEGGSQNFQKRRHLIFERPLTCYVDKTRGIINEKESKNDMF